MGLDNDGLLFPGDGYWCHWPHCLHILDRANSKMVDKQEIADHWHIPLDSCFTETLTLDSVTQNMGEWRLKQSDVPFIIRLIENPKYKLSWIFPGSTTIQAHDCIHIVLGRGVLLKDEAFVIGFTMGSTNQMTTLRSSLFLRCAQYLYPEGYKFRSAEAKIFRNGVRLAQIMNCENLSKFDFTKHVHVSIAELRDIIRLDVPLLRSYYEYEKRDNLECRECQRLV